MNKKIFAFPYLYDYFKTGILQHGDNQIIVRNIDGIADIEYICNGEFYRKRYPENTDTNIVEKDIYNNLNGFNLYK